MIDVDAVNCLMDWQGLHLHVTFVASGFSHDFLVPSYVRSRVFET